MIFGLFLCLVLQGIILHTEGAPFTTDLTKFTSGAGVRYVGSSNSKIGEGVVLIGDHNGDGFPDYMFSSFTVNMVVICMDANTTYTEQRSPFVSGKHFRVIYGPAASDFGSAIDGIGDINGDSFDDVIIGARSGQWPDRTGSPGFAFVIFGMEGPFVDLTVTPTWPASSQGFMIYGPLSGSSFVFSASTARGLGDVNGDGISDFAVSASNYNGPQAGAGSVWVIFGRKTSSFPTIDLLPIRFNSTFGIRLMGGFQTHNMGRVVDRAGDFNNDGIDDFLISAPNAPVVVNGTSRSQAGLVYLIYGTKTGLLSGSMSTFITGSRGIRFLGAAAIDGLGGGARGIGDINDDGIDDIAIGAPNADPLSRRNAGTVYVIYGTSSLFAKDVDLLHFGVSSAGFAVMGHVQSAMMCRVAPAGDINRDRVNDFLLSGNGGLGSVFLIYGQKEDRTETVDSLNDDTMRFFFTTTSALGVGFDGGKDLNFDGVPDVLLGAPSASVNGVNFVGAVWMLPGPFILPTDPPTAVPTTAAPTSLPPSNGPTRKPSLWPSIAPSEYTTPNPSAYPSTSAPTAWPTHFPSFSPIPPPTANPSIAPILVPSAAPSLEPSMEPTATPTIMPTLIPTMTPTMVPSKDPSTEPSMEPTATPTMNPTIMPTIAPTIMPTIATSAEPSNTPTATPTMKPTIMPTMVPSIAPTTYPSNQPSKLPTVKPTVWPTLMPMSTPTANPTTSPTEIPSHLPTFISTSTFPPTVTALLNYEVVVLVEQVSQN